MKLKIAVLFDGAGLARLGLEQAGHECTGYEIDPAKHHLSKMVGSGNCVLADVRDVDLRGFDAVWASPPCQERSKAKQNVESIEKKKLYADLLKWSISLPHDVLWVENVIDRNGWDNWGRKYNAAQFEVFPRQNRVRIIGGRYIDPAVYRQFQHQFDGVCPAVLASLGEKNYGPNVKPRKGGNGIMWYYGRCPTLRECAYHQGFEIPDSLLKSWLHIPELLNPRTGKLYTWPQWRSVLYEAIGNGVPTYMSKAFGQAYIGEEKGWINVPLFEVA